MYRSPFVTFRIGDSTNPHISTLSGLLALDGSDDAPRVFPGAELQIPDPLPRAGREFAVADGDADAGAYQGGFDVCLFVRAGLSTIIIKIKSEDKDKKWTVGIDSMGAEEREIERQCTTKHSTTQSPS